MVELWPDHLLPLDEWDALPEDNSRHYELVEGVLIVTPKPLPTHQRAAQRLAYWLDEQLPDGMTAVIDIEVTVAADFPPIVRAPDVTIAYSTAVDQGTARISAADVLCAIEIVSPGSKRTDRLVKPVEYAEAGIPAYWLVDLDAPVSLLPHSLSDSCYHAADEVTDTFSIDFPAPITIRLDDLTPRRI
ncbi:Uma2 family endonuclease [Kibdelosporangium philippinense]|uniref:Uma2 family endonuclease n=1 Tax=Kibdelosporangium philippinense TaxID=211113 RepID=A0ABS8ZJB9_9PSEU|nr:Uma2 family endonuclease [Kibdelosporangium philippinense]MCE7007894.1 Uma2 family endonuclease [Kibdelosporangium philippinense]